MALPIEATPTLYGEAAKLFIERFNNPSLWPKPKPVDSKKVYEAVMRILKEEKQETN